MHILIGICTLTMCMTRNRVSITITLPPELMDYIKKKVESREFANIAHGVELCVLRYKEHEEEMKREKV